jgi:hypothetical protein
MRPEPNRAVTTFSKTFRTHRFSPVANGKEYDKRPHIRRSFTPHSAWTGLHDGTAKKEEDDPNGSRRERRKRTFQIG